MRPAGDARFGSYLPFAAPSFALFCFGFFGVFAFLSIGSSSAGPLIRRFSHGPPLPYNPDNGS